MKSLRDLIGKRAEHQVHACSERNERSVHIAVAEPRPSYPKGNSVGSGKPPFQLANDALRVAIDVGADLHHWRAPGSRPSAASSQGRGMISRDEDRRPVDVLQAEHDTDFFGERRLFKMMQDDRVHDRHVTERSEIRLGCQYSLPDFGLLIRAARSKSIRIALGQQLKAPRQICRSTSFSLSSAIASEGLRPLGQALAQFMMVWQRYSRKRVLEIVEPLAGGFIAAVLDPSRGLQQRPPVPEKRSLFHQ